jgi:ribosomal-protein-alanine N-acetyltransferase
MHHSACEARSFRARTEKQVPHPVRNDRIKQSKIWLELKHGDGLIPFGGYGSHRRLLKELAAWGGKARLTEFLADRRKILSAKAMEAHRICGVSVTIRQYEPHDFTTIFKLDQSCFPAGIAYSKTMLKYYLAQPGAQCLIAADGAKIAGFLISEENPPLGHIVTLDVAETHRRQGVGSLLLSESETYMVFRGVRTVLLETATTNQGGIAFWERHGYRREAVLKNYYPGHLDAFEMRKLLSAAPRSAGKPRSES